MICRGGDDTQREAASGLPLESLGAANKRILQFSQVLSRLFKVKALMAHPCADSGLFIIPDEHT